MVVTVLFYAARQTLPCDLAKNYEVIKYCAQCENTFNNGVYDFDCVPKPGEEYFITVLMSFKDEIIQSGKTAEEFAAPKFSDFKDKSIAFNEEPGKIGKEKNSKSKQLELHYLLKNTKYEMIPFLKAAMTSNIDDLKSMYEQNNTIIDVFDDFGENALHKAAKFGTNSTVEYLLGIGMNINSTVKSYPYNNLFFSALGNKQNLLLINSINPDLKLSINNREETAVIHAVSNYDVSTVQFLVEEMNLTVNGIDYWDRNAFLVAAGKGKNSILDFLDFKNPALKYERGRKHTALTMAAENSNLDTIKHLVKKYDFNINDTTIYGDNAFILAVEKGSIDILQYLVSVDPTIKHSISNYKYTVPNNWNDGKYGDSLSIAICNREEKTTVEYLVEELKLNHTQIDENGRNLFMLAATYNRLSTMRYFNSKNPDLKHVRDHNNQSVLFLAIDFNSYSNSEKAAATLKFLIEEMKFDANITDIISEENIYMKSAKVGSVYMLRYLDSNFPHLKYAQDKNQYSAISYAIIGYSWRVLETIEYLVEEAGLLNQLDTDTDAQWEKSENNMEVKIFLISRKSVFSPFRTKMSNFFLLL